MHSLETTDNTLCFGMHKSKEPERNKHNWLGSKRQELGDLKGRWERYRDTKEGKQKTESCMVASHSGSNLGQTCKGKES